MDGQARAVLGRPADLVDVADVELRVHSLTEQVHAERDDVDVAGALAVAEQRAFDAVRTRHQSELRGGDRTTPVVVRMQRQHDAVTP